MSKYVKDVTPELVIETLKLLEPRLVPSENGVIDLNKEVREKWENILKRIVKDRTQNFRKLSKEFDKKMQKEFKVEL